MNKYLIGVIVIAVLGGVIFYLQPAPSSAPINETETTTTDTTATETSAKEFTVSGTDFLFEPTTIAVKKGDTVSITFKNLTGFHDFVIDEFKVATKRIKEGTEETVTFLADKAGSFEYYCSVGKHRTMGMKGTIIVTE